LLHAPIYALILFLWLTKPIFRSGPWFYALFALAITSSVQLAGVYMVFASLILPALASSKIAYAWLCGIGAVISGIIFAVMLDAPAGPVIVVCYAVITILTRLLAAKKL
jgi:zinc/manganese transport system permease protein